MSKAWGGRNRRMRRMLDAQLNCDGGQRSATVTWLDEHRVVVLAGRRLGVHGRIEALVALTAEGTPVSLQLQVDSVHTGSDNPCGIGALHVCCYRTGAGDQARIAAALPELHRRRGGDSDSTTSSAGRSLGSTVPAGRRSPRHAAPPASEPAPEVAQALFAPGDPPSLLVPFRGWDQVARTVRPNGSALRLRLAPVVGLSEHAPLAVVVQLPTGITVQLEAMVVRTSSRELLVEAWSVPPWARSAMRLAG